MAKNRKKWAPFPLAKKRDYLLKIGGYKVTWSGWTKQKMWPFKGQRRCSRCEFVPQNGEFMWIRTRQRSWFRGDDEVLSYCNECGLEQLSEDRKVRTDGY